MNRGPAPLAPDLKLLAGERADRMPSAIAGDLAAPECPDWLDRDAAAEWARICGVLARQGTLREALGPLLEVYCDAHALWLAARRELAHGADAGDDQAGDDQAGGDAPPRPRHRGYGSVTCTTDAGSVKGNPAAGVLAKAWGTKLRVLAELGLTPSTMAKLAGPPEAPRDELDDFARRRPG